MTSTHPSVTVREGGLSLRLRRGHSTAKGRRYQRWEFRDPATGARVRRHSLDAAKAEARRRLKLMARRGFELSGRDAEEWLQCLDAAARQGCAVGELVRLGADARARETRALTGSPMGVAEAVEAFLAARRGAAGPEHLRDLAVRLRRFARDFSGPVGGMTAAKLDLWLGALKGSPRTRRNYRGAIGLWLSHERAAGNLHADFGLLARAGKARAGDGDIGIFTPAEMRLLLGAAGDRLLPLLVLGAFAGLRTSEALRLDWSGVNWSEDSLIVPHGTKTGRRVVPMTANLRAWLEPMRRTGRVAGVTPAGCAKAFARLVERAGVPWRRNGLRHSFVSYRCAAVTDLHRVSYECGHSVGMLKRHYLQMVTPGAAAEWFAILPEAPANVSLMTIQDVISVPQPGHNRAGRRGIAK